MTLTTDNAVLLLIDLQQKLVPVIADGDTMVARSVRLAEAAQLLGVPVRATEQYPAGLGPTVAALAAYPQETLAKTTFSAAGDPGFAALLPAGTREVVIAGCEAHVCVLQTALDLVDPGTAWPWPPTRPARATRLTRWPGSPVPGSTAPTS